MSALNHQTPLPPPSSCAQKLNIRIPRWAWNAYQPHSQAQQDPTIILSAGRTPRFKLKLNATINDLAGSKSPSLSDIARGKEPAFIPLQRTSCKFKLWNFHYGGPKRAIKGASQHEIAYETPCLQPTCANCWRWQPQLMGTQALLEALRGDIPYSFDSDIEPISPEIDPRILDGTWRFHQSQQVNAKRTASLAFSATSNAAALTPVNRSFNDHDQPLDRNPLMQPVYNTIGPSSTNWHILLPVPLVEKAIADAPLKTKWRSTPRKSYVARLALQTLEGRRQFGDILRKLEKKARKKVYDRAYRARLKLARRQERMSTNYNGAT